MGFFRKEYLSVLPFPSPGDLPHPGNKSVFPALQVDPLLSEPQGKLKLAQGAGIFWGRRAVAAETHEVKKGAGR